MLKRQQLNLEFKVQQPRQLSSYQPEGKGNSFQHQQTPGWTSLIHNETNRVVGLEDDWRTEQLAVFERLQQLDSIDLARSNYSKIRLPENGNLAGSLKKSNLTQSRGKSNKENDSRQIQRFNIDEESRKRQPTTAMRTESRTQNSLINSNLSVKKTGTIIKNVKNKQVTAEQKTQKSKRFKQITVHDHLYLEAKRQQTKRTMEQVLEQQYRKQHLLTFTPQISHKSHLLAANKFARMQDRIELERQLAAEVESAKIGQKRRERNSEQMQLERQQERCRVLNKLFYMLSQNRQIMTKQTIAYIIEELPLACLKLIENIVTKLFQGKEFTWLHFLGQVNNKKIVSSREALVRVTEKWLSRLENKKKDQQHETKDETHPNL